MTKTNDSSSFVSSSTVCTTLSDTKHLKDFWNKYHKEIPQQEWLLEKSPQLLEKIRTAIHHHQQSQQEQTDELFKKKKEGQGQTTNVYIMEVGCGTSTLSRSLLEYLIHHHHHHHEKNTNGRHHKNQYFYNVLSTDISPIACEHNKNRDSSFISSLEGEKEEAAGSLQYQVYDVVVNDSNSTFFNNENNTKQSFILDKACLDTLLFRSKKTKGYSPLVEQMLNNIHSILQDDGIYFLITPRKKIKEVRDFKGFLSPIHIETISSSSSSSSCSEQDYKFALVQKGNEFSKTNKADNKEVKKKKDKKCCVYIHTCVKNNSYIPSSSSSSFTIHHQNLHR